MARRDPFPEVGDRFTRVGMFSKDFEIVEIYERHGHPPHARLISVDDGQDLVTLAVSVLLDRNFYRPAERRPQPPARPAPRAPQLARDIAAIPEREGPAPVPEIRRDGERRGGLSRLFGRRRGLSPV